ncbi:GTP-binding protein EngA, putative [Eimeria necatrix]|uniref:GTPase Der n=1 Tax=Eimeria necatrix TaxID=51315 RepID=U6N3U6_9EIME|nr:GTP-binding protein EngA, putative [Eimeria necatrix]CDJ69979.1 GTP-binding protein EngA, putative [Eimeria necatrix]
MEDHLGAKQRPFGLTQQFLLPVVVDGQGRAAAVSRHCIVEASGTRRTASRVLLLSRLFLLLLPLARTHCSPLLHQRGDVVALRKPYPCRGLQSLGWLKRDLFPGASKATFLSPLTASMPPEVGTATTPAASTSVCRLPALSAGGGMRASALLSDEADETRAFNHTTGASPRRCHRICLLGRPNVGKSALFNRICFGDLTGGFRGGALVSSAAGTTRDCLLSLIEWRGTEFEVADTGGIVMEDASLGPFAAELRDQVSFAIQQATCVILVVDGRAGVQEDDEYLAELSRHLKAPVVLCVNKCENPKTAVAEAQAFWRLGLGVPMPCSAATGSGVSELLDRCVEAVKCHENAPSRTSLRPSEGSLQDGLRDHVRVALIGRPNAGKSRLLNRLVNYQRSIVSPIPGTTRDAVDEFVSRGNRLYCVVDTAGIRRASGIRKTVNIDAHMVARAKTAAQRADVCLLVVDALAGLTHQDVNLAKMLEAFGRGVVVVLNKWDVALQTNDFKHNEAVEYVRKVLFPLYWSEVLFVSAETGEGVAKIWTAVDAAVNQPPTIVVFCNKSEFFSEAYKRYIDYSVRGAFSMHSTPIRSLFAEC